MPDQKTPNSRNRKDIPKGPQKAILNYKNEKQKGKLKKLKALSDLT